MINWQQLFLTVLSILVPLFIYLRTQKEELRKEQNRRHEENAEKLDSILSEQEYLPQHWHNETDGALSVRGIQRKPRNGHR